MITLGRRRILSALLTLFALLTIWRARELSAPSSGKLPVKPATSRPRYEPDKDYFWRTIAHEHPVSTFRPMPTAAADADALPRIQADVFAAETAAEKEVRLSRQRDVRDSFVKSWKAYKKHAWLRDEVTPVSGGAKDPFGGWGATLIDALDTLWVMDLKDEFDEAVYDVAENALFLFTKARDINVFETAIRFLGGLLAAYDLSGDARLLAKAHNVGDMLYKAFDTPNHLPVTRWNLHEAARGAAQTASSTTLLAEIGSLALEFTRLSLVTGDPKYYDAVQHVSELLAASQDKSKLPGLWPVVVDADAEYFDAGSTYTLGAMADSTYEYMPKMMALLGQPTGIYRDMYLKTVDAARAALFFRPMTPDRADILFSGFVTVDPEDASRKKHLRPAAGHLTCFVGGLLALGGRLTATRDHVADGAKLTDGCVWAYKSFRRGVMPESFYLTPCPPSSSPDPDPAPAPDREPCPWDPSAWHREVLNAHSSPGGPAKQAESIIEKENLPPSFSSIGDPRYVLRPEAIESIFILYRITGDRAWQEKAWHMWKAIDTMTSTPLAYSAVRDVNPPPGQKPPLADSMESFWLAETLKYFYLIFGEPDVLSLDEWVFNTEAHPFRRMR
ncbi:hypothetical protein E4U42_001448 [Claviceps africana]|uniref:alpha-1,2-Mannosidase n=1 Tax=Claviceps africana TaxID=83212 RepID=A0A8K0J4F3_9HYPO|nr:hypothetical protein E4U42_001448 [Claviceps africana]